MGCDIRLRAFRTNPVPPQCACPFVFITCLHTSAWGVVLQLGNPDILLIGLELTLGILNRRTIHVSLDALRNMGIK